MYQLKMSRKKIISNCTTDWRNQRFKCVMNFIISKMNCTIKWKKSYYSTKDVPICQTKEDLKLYFNIKHNIYKADY